MRQGASQKSEAKEIYSFNPSFQSVTVDGSLPLRQLIERRGYQIF